MANKSVKRVSRPKSRAGTITLFWICIALILAPFAVMGYILYTSSRDSSKPVFGSRYAGDLDPAITTEQIGQISEAVKGIEGVESGNATMTTATLRIYADVKDDADAEYAKGKADEIYTAVSGVLNPDVYFTQADGKKMYDLEIHVYNLAENRDSDAFVYVIEEKNSAMKKPKKQVVSEPKNAKLAERLRKEAAERQAAEEAAKQEEAGEVEVGGGEELPEETEENNQEQ